MSEIDALFRHTSGPRNARVMLVGEAWDRNEAVQKRPFVGYSGLELNKMLAEAGLSRDSILCTNIIHSQPPSDDFTHFLIPTKETKGAGAAPYAGIHPKPLLSSSIRDLWRLIDLVSPQLILAAGNLSMHILTSHAKVSTTRGYKLPAGITSWRGSQTYTREVSADPVLANRYGITSKRVPVLPIIHPVDVCRAWGFRSPTVHDLRARAGRFISGLRAWEPPSTNDVWAPSYDFVSRALNLWLAQVSHRPLWLSVDIETYQRTYISCIGISDNDLALCIPFFYFISNQTRAYWTLEQECEIWLRLRNLLEHPNVRIIGQNFIYDSLFLQRYCGINAFPAFDTMVGHHLLYPGTPMALHYLASLYCDHHLYWKDESEEWAVDELSAEDLWKYNCKDIRKTFECAEVLRQLIHNRPGYNEHFAWRMREWRLGRKMSIRGIRDDTALRRQMQTDCFHQAHRLSTWLMEVMPTPWRFAKSGKPWFSSPQATMYILYDRLGLTPVLQKKTKRPTCDDSALEELIARKDTAWLRPLLQHLQAFRSLGVFRSHFLDIKLGPTGRFNYQVNISRPETFRWSTSANPFDEGTNSQNMPKVEVD